MIEKKIQKSLSRRSFLQCFAASLSCYPIYLILCEFFLPTFAIAQKKPPAAPSFGGGQSNEKIVFEKEITNRAVELSNRWDENAMKNNRYLTPEQKKDQREEVEKVIRNIVEKKGYKISAPKNFRIIN